MLQHLCRRRGSRRRRRAAQETGTRQLLKAGAAWQGCGRAAPACGKLADGEQAQLQAWTGCQPWPPYTPTPAAKPPAGPHTRAHTQLHTHTHTNTLTDTQSHTHTTALTRAVHYVCLHDTAGIHILYALLGCTGRQAGRRAAAGRQLAGRPGPTSQPARRGLRSHTLPADGPALVLPILRHAALPPAMHPPTLRNDAAEVVPELPRLLRLLAVQPKHVVQRSPGLR